MSGANEAGERMTQYSARQIHRHYTQCALTRSPSKPVIDEEEKKSESK